MSQGKITISTSCSMQLIDITEQIEKEIIRTNIKEGICYLFNPHTTAGLTLNEGTDPTVKDDIISGFQKMIPCSIPTNILRETQPSHILNNINLLNFFFSPIMTLDSHQICFGLNQQLDRQSLSCFLQLAGREEFADVLSQRLSTQEIHDLVDFFTGILKRHFSEEEYHRLFLQDEHCHPHHPEEKG